MTSTDFLKAPFPYFGGKATIAVDQGDVHGVKGLERPTLSGASKTWPTPIARDAKVAVDPESRDRLMGSLDEAAEFLYSHQVSAWRHSGSPKKKPTSTRKRRHLRSRNC